MRRRLPVIALAIAAALIALAAAAVVAVLNDGSSPRAAGARPYRPGTPDLAAVRLEDVAGRVGLGFRQGAFRFGVTNDPVAMMGGGLCWIDYDRDGWLDLYVVNSYAESQLDSWEKRGGPPRSALFHNVEGRFVDVSAGSGADLAVRGNGCVAADFDLDGWTDLYVTTAGRGALLWNEGDGTFTEGANAAGVDDFGWHTGAAVGDVNGDGWPDLFVAGYADLHSPVENATQGFPNTYAGVRDLLFVSNGKSDMGRVTFREIGVEAGLEAARFAYGLGAVFSDFDRDGDLDLFVANDTNPNRMYENVPWPGGSAADPAGLGFRFDERAASAGVADPNAGMGIAAADYDGDGRNDLFVTNARRQEHAVYRSQPLAASAPSFVDTRAVFADTFDGMFTGWGVSWADLDLDTDLDVVLANGAVPVTSLKKDAEPIQLVESRAAQGIPDGFADASATVGLDTIRTTNGRGSAAVDYDNDGDIDVAVNSVGGRLVLLRNSAQTGNWLEVAVHGFEPGTEVTVVLPDGRELRRELNVGSSYLSSEDPRLHFGLGEARKVRELVVRVPGRAETRLDDVAANQVVEVEPPERKAQPAETSPSTYLVDDCTRPATDQRSVARRWDEALLDAIRRDVPAPTTHARNLFHVSAAMWDAWAAYDTTADGYFVTEKHEADDTRAAREAAISYAAYRLLLHRYSLATNVEKTFSELSSVMESLCYRIDYTSTEGDSPAALGNRIAAAVIAAGRKDGSHEQQRYADPTYKPVNEPLVVKEPEGVMHDATLWQPLALDRLVAQNGLPIPGSVQGYVGPQWGHVKGFAVEPSRRGLPIDPGAPGLGVPEDAAFKRAALEVIRKSSELDPADGKTIDIGPGTRGDNTLGTNDGDGHDVNPVTGKPYAPDRVARGDYGRALAEFWADGPSSETPPGHWNVIANEVSDSPAMARRRRQTGPADRLEWDVKLYFALNGAVHDAAITAWGAKREYETARPISMIRYLGWRGQSSDPAAPSYDPKGLPLVPGLVEVVTRASSAPGQRHAALADHVGEIAVRTWQGPPEDPARKAGVGWILGSRWMPYQRPTFVTPAFPGYVSGHSTFSRAAAEVLTAFTGSAYFPGGLFESRQPRGSLDVERGPSRDVVLQAATYYDAADQAGISRIYGGIHIPEDDFAGRKIGSVCGKHALALARRYLDGSARP
ncbi:MAG TPA: FG-GAP-like repeat-containing protein [Gaiellaceae bacterium]|nr:FG-GAP-like repeat-containing protein [Gaiellaceae bacterium]